VRGSEISAKISWEVPKLSEDARFQIHKTKDHLSWLHLFLRLTLHLVSTTLLIITANSQFFLLLIPLALINGMLVTFLGWAGAGHEYFHSTAFRSGHVNRFLFRLFSCATWNNWGWFEVSHQLHHKYTLHNLDPESPVKFKFGVFKWFWLITIDLPTLIRRFLILVKNAFGLAPIKNPEIKSIMESRASFKRKIRIGALTVFFYQTLVFTIVSQINLIVAIILVLSPFTFTFVNKVVEMNQHKMMKFHSLDFRQNSRTMRFNPVIEFLYANMNFHSEHHMYPSVPYYNLPRLNLFLLDQGQISKPSKGFLLAVKTATKSQEGSFDQMGCLSCVTKCPKK
jgi:fatty acid desaturase